MFLGCSLHPFLLLLLFVSRLFLGASQTGSKRPGPEQRSWTFTKAQPGSHLQAEPFYSVDYNAKLTWPCTNHCYRRPSLPPMALTQNLNSKFNGTVVPPPPRDMLAPYEKPPKVRPTLSATILFVLLLEPPVTLAAMRGIPRIKPSKKPFACNVR